jgi:sporulation protein YlmC with PRC-barrel domain
LDRARGKDDHREGVTVKHFRSFVVVLVCSALFVPVQPLFAADKETRGTQRAESAEVRQHPGGLIQAEWLQRRAIKDDQGREIGTIEEVWLDPSDGRVKEVVVSVGGFLGMGDKHRILSWQDVRVTWEKQDLVVRASEDALRRARVSEESGQQPAASPETRPKR